MTDIFALLTLTHSSAKELFRYKNQGDQAIPQKGGQKEFQTDGSWLQSKHVESFHQERQRALTEPRVMRKYVALTFVCKTFVDYDTLLSKKLCYWMAIDWIN